MIRKRTLVFCCLAATVVPAAWGEPAAPPSANVAGKVRIAEPGKAPVIITVAEPPDQVAYAVEDLQKYLGRILGQDVQVSKGRTPPSGFGLFIGEVPENVDLKAVIAEKKLGDQGFVLDVSGKGARILGGGKFGTAYGVYELLERLGVRWLFPGEWGEVVPEAKTLELPAGRFTDKPVFEIRAQHTAHVGRPFGDWARRMRHNRCGFYGHSGLISPKKYGQDHPEWYAEVDGKRHLEGNFKLCHSNPEMVKQAVADVLEQLRQWKADKNVLNHVGYLHQAEDYFVVSVSPTDGGGFCRCPECRKMGSVSDRLQIFANTIAEAVQKEFPGYYVGYYGAYSEHQNPPTVKAHPNVMVFLTTWTKSFFEPLASPLNKAFREKYEAFTPQCPNIVLRDYDGLSVWWGFGPFTLADVHAVDYPWYLEHGMCGVVTEAQIGWGPWGYSYYLTSKLWWNPRADLAALKRDFVQSGYGEAAEPMTRYYQRLDEAKVYPPPATLYAMRRDLEEAAKLARRPDVRRRIDYLRAYYFLYDTYSRIQNGQAGPEEVQTAFRVLHSIDPHVSPIGEKHLSRAVEGKSVETVPLTEPELRTILDKVVLTKPNDLAVWSDADDARLTPVKAGGGESNSDMGANFRYGPHTFLVYAKANERIRIWQQGQTKTQYELVDPEQTVVAQGTAEEEAVLDRLAATEGVYRFTFSTGGYRPRIHVANRGAVVKASGALQHVHTFGKAEFYFYVPKGTKTFAVIGKAEEPLVLEVFGPYDAQTPVYPKTTQKATSFQEHAVTVPPGTDGAVWRINLGGEDKKIFLQGIPPFLAGSPDRVLVLP